MTRKHPAHVITNDSVTGSAEIERSLKFHDGDSAYLSRTPGSAGNRKTFTFSCWFKRSTLGTQSGAFLKAERTSLRYSRGLREKALEKLWEKCCELEKASSTAIWLMFNSVSVSRRLAS